MRAPRFRVRLVEAAMRFRLAAVAIAAVALFAFAGAGALAHTGSSALTSQADRGVANAYPSQDTWVPEAPDTTSNPAILAPADLIVDESDGHVDLTVRLSDQGDNPVSVHYATADSTAVASTACNFDYVGASGTLNFSPGETSKTVQVQILDCPDAEGFEAFTFELSTAVNGVISRASSLVGIVDNDHRRRDPATVRARRGRRREGRQRAGLGADGRLRPARRRTAPSPSPTRPRTAPRVPAPTTPQSAERSRFAPGETAKTVVVPIVDDAPLRGRRASRSA